MAKYQIINLTFLNLALLTTITPSSLTSVSTKAVSLNEIFYQESLAKAGVKGANIVTHQSVSNLPDRPLNSTQQQNQLNHHLVTDSGLAESKNNQKELPIPKKPLEFFPLAFFLLFFIPLGIFYPLFLFYRKLLIHPDERNYSPTEDSRFESINNQFLQTEIGSNAEENFDQATVSKLQIAFSPTNRDLRRKLGQLTSGGELNDIVRLMRRTVTLLISQDCWTHVNYASATLPLEDVKVEFNLMSYQERNKFTSDNLSLINRNSEVNPSHSSNDNYGYVVVTLILCTNHIQPLFNKIFTKKQLVVELLKLSKMRKDYLIKFELLWNPQEEDKYLGNDYILTEYSEMNRLL